MLAPAPKRRNPFWRSWTSLIGLGVLMVMLVACLGSLPYTLGRADVAANSAEQEVRSVQRFNDGVTAMNRLPPSWIAKNDEQARRVSEFQSSTPASTTQRTPSFFLGTDALGRSVLIRVLLGGAMSLVIGIAAASLSVCIGTMYGAIAGYIGGRTDAVMMRVVDVLYGLPYVLLVVLLAVASDAMMGEYLSRSKVRSEYVIQAATEVVAMQSATTENKNISRRDAARDYLVANPQKKAALEVEAMQQFPPRRVSDATRTSFDLLTLLVAIGGVSWLTMARVIRGQVLSLKNQPFIEASRAMGFSTPRIFIRHLLPNLVGPIVVYATLTVPQAMLQESFLSFLGIGVKPPLPSWGNLAADGLVELNPYQSNWWLLLFPCLALGLTLLSLNFVGEGLRAALDPKDRK